jgi:hypothetical protein
MCGNTSEIHERKHIKGKRITESLIIVHNDVGMNVKCHFHQRRVRAVRQRVLVAYPTSHRPYGCVAHLRISSPSRYRHVRSSPKQKGYRVLQVRIGDNQNTRKDRVQQIKTGKTAS